MEFLFGHEITEAQRQKALDAAVAEDLHRGEPRASFSFQDNQQMNHTSDTGLIQIKTCQKGSYHALCLSMSLPFHRSIDIVAFVIGFRPVFQRFAFSPLFPPTRPTVPVHPSSPPAPACRALSHRPSPPAHDRPTDRPPACGSCLSCRSRREPTASDRPFAAGTFPEISCPMPSNNHLIFRAFYQEIFVQVFVFLGRFVPFGEKVQKLQGGCLRGLHELKELRKTAR